MSSNLLLKKVKVTFSDKDPQEGTVQYFGPTKFAAGDWVGVALTTPDGKHDGSVDGVSYFKCKPAHGVFVKPAHVEVITRTTRVARTPASPAPGPTPDDTAAGPQRAKQDTKQSPPAAEPPAPAAEPPAAAAEPPAPPPPAAAEPPAPPPPAAAAEPFSPQRLPTIVDQTPRTPHSVDVTVVTAANKHLSGPDDTTELKLQLAEALAKVTALEQQRDDLEDKFTALRSRLLASDGRTVKASAESQPGAHSKREDALLRELESARKARTDALRAAADAQASADDANFRAESLELDLELAKAETANAVSQLEGFQNAAVAAASDAATGASPEVAALIGKLRHQLEAASAELAVAKPAASRCEAAEREVVKLRADVKELKESLDAASDAAAVAERLTERNIELEEKVADLNERIAEMDEDKDLQRQLEEVSNETTQALRSRNAMLEASLLSERAAASASASAVRERDALLDQYRLKLDSMAVDLAAARRMSETATATAAQVRDINASTAQTRVQEASRVERYAELERSYLQVKLRETLKSANSLRSLLPASTSSLDGNIPGTIAAVGVGQMLVSSLSEVLIDRVRICLAVPPLPGVSLSSSMLSVVTSDVGDALAKDRTVVRRALFALSSVCLLQSVVQPAISTITAFNGEKGHWFAPAALASARAGAEHGATALWNFFETIRGDLLDVGSVSSFSDDMASYVTSIMEPVAVAVAEASAAGSLVNVAGTPVPWATVLELARGLSTSLSASEALIALVHLMIVRHAESGDPATASTLVSLAGRLENALRSARSCVSTIGKIVSNSNFGTSLISIGASLCTVPDAPAALYSSLVTANVVNRACCAVLEDILNAVGDTASGLADAMAPSAAAGSVVANLLEHPAIKVAKLSPNCLLESLTGVGGDEIGHETNRHFIDQTASLASLRIASTSCVLGAVITSTSPTAPSVDLSDASFGLSVEALVSAMSGSLEKLADSLLTVQVSEAPMPPMEPTFQGLPPGSSMVTLPSVGACLAETRTKAVRMSFSIVEELIAQQAELKKNIISSAASSTSLKEKMDEIVALKATITTMAETARETAAQMKEMEEKLASAQADSDERVAEVEAELGGVVEDLGDENEKLRAAVNELRAQVESAGTPKRPQASDVKSPVPRDAVTTRRRTGTVRAGSSLPPSRSSHLLSLELLRKSQLISYLMKERDTLQLRLAEALSRTCPWDGLSSASYRSQKDSSSSLQILSTRLESARRDAVALALRTTIAKPSLPDPKLSVSAHLLRTPFVPVNLPAPSSTSESPFLLKSWIADNMVRRDVQNRVDSVMGEFRRTACPAEA